MVQLLGLTNHQTLTACEIPNVPNALVVGGIAYDERTTKYWGNVGWLT